MRPGWVQHLFPQVCTCVHGWSCVWTVLGTTGFLTTCLCTTNRSSQRERWLSFRATLCNRTVRPYSSSSASLIPGGDLLWPSLAHSRSLFCKYFMDCKRNSCFPVALWLAQFPSAGSPVLCCAAVAASARPTPASPMGRAAAALPGTVQCFAVYLSLKAPK